MKNNLKTIYQYVKNFQFNSIFVRNFILIVLAIFLPLITACSAFYLNAKSAANAEVSSISQNNVITIKSVTDTILHTTDTLALQTALNSDVHSFCLPINDSDNSQISSIYQKIRSYIQNFTNIYPYINSIYVYSEMRNMVIDNQQATPFNDIQDSSWYAYYENSSKNEAIIVPRKKFDRYPSLISVIRNIYIEGVGKIGCVVINLDVEQLNEIISSVEENDLYHTVIFNDDKDILLCKDIKKTGENLYSYLGYTTNSSLSDNDSGHINFQKQEYMYAQKSSDYYGITYLLLIPQTYFNNILVQPLAFFIIACCLILFIGFVISFVTSIKIYSPIQNIMNLLLPLESIESLDKNKKSETTYITETIRKTIDKTDALSEELNYRLFLLKDAQAYALQAQINPHFLNNTLEAINWTAISKLGEKNKISEMIKSLSALLDISLNNEHFLIPIEEELQHTNIYTYIMSLNYGSDLNFIWDIENSVSEHKIVKLSLQPILENAVVHGINPNRGKGEIVIRGRFHNDGILITISDNGVGMSAEELLKLQKELKADTLKGKCIGIKNVNQRIKLFYGEKYGLNIYSQKGVGTTVELFIPKTDL